jgi:hypothetical protein
MERRALSLLIFCANYHCMRRDRISLSRNDTNLFFRMLLSSCHHAMPSQPSGHRSKIVTVEPLIPYLIFNPLHPSFPHITLQNTLQVFYNACSHHRLLCICMQEEKSLLSYPPLISLRSHQNPKKLFHGTALASLAFLQSHLLKLTAKSHVCIF